MRNRRKITVASVQIDVITKNVESTRSKVLSWIDQAAGNGADIVLFPELVLSAGYSLGEQFYDLAESIPGPSTDTLGKKAKEHNIYIIAGVAERDTTGTVYNTAVIIGRNGHVVGTYRKTHLFTPTESFFRLGTSLPVFTLDFGCIGIPICYDLEFPETARSLCLKGAELLLSMAAHWAGTGIVGTPENFIRTIYAARALENRIPVVLSNRVGFDAGLNARFVGLSRIVDANGMTMTEIPDDREGMIVAQLDLHAEQQKRCAYNYFRDRKPLLYQSLVKAE
ncbi:MAG: carbon-nitrogen hydrolase family protein [Candidatus Hodarchaeota archaeon]